MVNIREDVTGNHGEKWCKHPWMNTAGKRTPNQAYIASMAKVARVVFS